MRREPYRTPVPQRDRETATKANGPVITYQLSPDELEKYRNEPRQTYKRPTGLPSRNNFSSEKQSERAKKRYEGAGDMISKEQYLEERLAGKSRTSIYKSRGINPGVFYKALEEWGIKEQAKEEELLKTLGGVSADGQAENEEPQDVQQDPDAVPPAEGGKESDVAGQDVLAGTKTAGESAVNVGSPEVAADILYLTIRIPIIADADDRFGQIKKVYEELEEVGAEIEASNIDRRKAAGELYDLVQAFAGLIRAELSDLVVSGSVDGLLQEFFDHHNRQHVDKIQRYAAERGWRIVG